MQIIQLYIEGQRVDLYEDESIDITQTIQNSKDIGKVFGDFSRSFTVPASRNNNKIFKHYYNSSIDDGFDARKKVDSLIRLNGVDFRKGRLKLEGVDLKDNKAQSYRITFYGNIVNLKDLVGEDKLDNLNWLRSFNVTYNLSTTLQYLQNGKDVTVDSVLYPEAVKVPLISAQQRLYFDSGESIAGKGNLSTHDSVAHGVEWYQMKPAIRLYVIIKAIEERYNILNGYPSDIKFSDDFFNVGNEKFHDLYMWLHRKAGTVFQGIDGTLKDTIDTLPTVTWNGAQFNGSYFSIYDVYQFGAQYYSTEITLNTLAGSEFSFSVQKNGQSIFDSGVITGQTQYVFDIGQLGNGSYTLHLESENVITVDGNINMSRVHYYYPTEVENFAIGSFAMSSDFKFEIQSQVPDIKIIDFLSGLFKMFNLTAYEEEGIITVKPLDEYYLFGGEYDISEYVDINKSSVDSALLYKQIEFGYQGVKNLQANKHNELFNYNWGEEKYSGGDYYDGQIYKLTLPFEHMKMERLVNINTGANSSVQWGWMVDKLNSSDEYANGSTYLGKPLLFYPVKVSGADSIRVTSSGSYTDVTSYYVPSNSQLLTDSFNINFKAELNEYTNTIFEDTLFYRYYRNYIAGVFDFRNRMTKVTAYLPLKILLKYKLADRFIINNKKYLINSIQTNLLTGKSEIELLNDIAITYPLDPSELPRLGACTTQPETGVNEESFIANGTITDVGYPPYFEKGFFYNAGTGTPTEASSKMVVSGTGLGAFLSTIAGLSSSTTYTYAAYVKNSAGTFIGNSEQVTTATATPLEAPTVSTTGETNVQATSVTLNGNVTNVGNPAITSRGFYWVQGTGTPSAANNVITVPGASGGSYFSNLTGLTEGVTYSYRAWADNGVDPIALGAVDQFTPQAPVAQYPPTVVNSGADFGYTTAILYGNVTDIGNPAYFQKGFYWMQGSGTPDSADNIIYVSGTSGGAFNTGEFGGLLENTLYSFRPFIVSGLGTYYGATNTFTTQETPTVTCDGGTLFFTGASVTGVNATLQTGNLPYSTSQCSGTISTLSLLLTNNDTGEWVSAAQITSVQMFEGATNVTGDYSIGVVFNSGQIFITVGGNFPDAFNDGDHSYSFVIQATAVELISTTITISDSVAHASKNVVANTSPSFPASRNGNTGNSVCIPQGEDGDAFEYTVTYTADPGYEFIGIGNITQPLVSPSGVGVGVTAGTYSSTTLTVIISGNIQAVDQAATVSWSGTAIADPATSINIEWRYQGQSTWNAIPGAGIDIGTGGLVVELKVTPDGSWYALPAVVNLIDAYSPTEDYSGDQVFMDVDIRVVGGGEPTQATLLRFYPRASATSIAAVRFQYYQAI